MWSHWWHFGMWVTKWSMAVKASALVRLKSLEEDKRNDPRPICNHEGGIKHSDSNPNRHTIGNNLLRIA